jgi:hypothetical protein
VGLFDKVRVQLQVGPMETHLPRDGAMTQAMPMSRGTSKRPRRHGRAWCSFAVPLLCLLGPAVVHAQSQRRLHVWLVTKGIISLVPAKEGTLVLLSGDTEYTVAPGYLLDEQGLREEPSLFAGLPVAADPPPSNAVYPTGTVLFGSVSISGEWPRKATLILHNAPNACDGCWDQYTWRKQRWALDPKPPRLPVWDDMGRGIIGSLVEFSNGTKLWQKFHMLEGVDYPAGKVTFYKDPYGRERASRQRQVGPSKCGGGARVMGHFAGIPLSDGGLLHVGPDCETGVAEVEFWQKGAVRSQVTALPDRPLGPFLEHPLSESGVFYLVRSPKDMVVGFTTVDAAQSPLGTYVAAFDGKAWTNLSPPAAGRMRDLQEAADGTLWMVVESSEGNMVWRRPLDGPWQDVTPPVVTERSDSSPEVSLGEGGAPWMTVSSARVVLHWEDAAWHAYALPSLSNPEEPCYTWGFALGKRKEPLVLGDCGSRKALLLLGPAPSIMER